VGTETSAAGPYADPVDQAATEVSTDIGDLFARRLLIQSGKGGTGKTTTSAALAVLAARRGKRVLLVEVDTHDRFAALFGKPQPVAYKVADVGRGVHALNLDPKQVILDFFKTHLRFTAFSRQIANSKIFQYFYAAAPGLRELLCLGKIWRLLEEQREGEPAWDCVVLDAPATGHGLAILNIARIAHDSLFGPMKEHARKIRDMLRDPQITTLNLCALPEEMPVNEAADLFQAAVSDLDIPVGVVFMNAVVTPLFTPENAALYEQHAAALVTPGSPLARALGGQAAGTAIQRGLQRRDARAMLSGQALERIRARIPRPVVEIPFIPNMCFDPASLERVTDHLERALSAMDAAPPQESCGSREEAA
jgi:anion-transporting  ArsA/GET3 family ATPase